MLPSKEELAKQYANFPDHKLLDILYKKREYRPEAIEAVTEELKKRNISPENVTDFIKEKKAKKVIASENAHLPLPFYLKLLFFFGWFIPFFFGSAIRLNYQEDGMIRKSGQSLLYGIAGFIATILTVVPTIAFSLSNMVSFLILIGLFCAFYALEEYLLLSKSKRKSRPKTRLKS